MPSSLPKNLLSICAAFVIVLASVDGLAVPSPQNINKSINNNNNNDSRRAFLSASATAAAFLAIPKIASARYILNDETGEYDKVEDEDWQTTWGKRLDKAKTMGTEDVFLAAQGAGNLDLRESGVEESEASKKRRALAGCRNDNFRAKGGVGNVKECTARVIGGDYQFMIDAM